MPNLSSADTEPDGWNFEFKSISAAIDWNDSTILKTGIDNAIYIWNPELGVYSSYVDGIGTNGGSSVIASAHKSAFLCKQMQQVSESNLLGLYKTEATSVFF
ncbi:MAG: hypothetical protein IPG07_12480 [Crocinitomicaceae bacterium]|nr:hypothetical protein [Crocinitomicaceae bacterium]